MSAPQRDAHDPCARGMRMPHAHDPCGYLMRMTYAHTSAKSVCSSAGRVGMRTDALARERAKLGVDFVRRDERTRGRADERTRGLLLHPARPPRGHSGGLRARLARRSLSRRHLCTAAGVAPGVRGSLGARAGAAGRSLIRRRRGFGIRRRRFLLCAFARCGRARGSRCLRAIATRAARRRCGRCGRPRGALAAPEAAEARAALRRRREHRAALLQRQRLRLAILGDLGVLLLVGDVGAVSAVEHLDACVREVLDETVGVGFLLQVDDLTCTLERHGVRVVLLDRSVLATVLQVGAEAPDVGDDGLALGGLPECETIIANVGRCAPYLKYGSKYASLKEDDPYTVTLERAREVIRLKKEADANRLIQDFPDAGIQVLNGRYGPYITDKKKNAKIPKDREPKSLTLEECRAMLAAAPERGARFGRFRRGQRAAGATAAAAAAASSPGGDGAQAAAASSAAAPRKGAKKKAPSPDAKPPAAANQRPAGGARARSKASAHAGRNPRRRAKVAPRKTAAGKTRAKTSGVSPGRARGVK